MHAQFVIEVCQTKVEVFLRLTNVMIMPTTDYEVLYNVVMSGVVKFCAQYLIWS